MFFYLWKQGNVIYSSSCLQECDTKISEQNKSHFIFKYLKLRKFIPGDKKNNRKKISTLKNTYTTEYLYYQVSKLHILFFDVFEDSTTYICWDTLYSIVTILCCFVTLRLVHLWNVFQNWMFLKIAKYSKK